MSDITKVIERIKEFCKNRGYSINGGDMFEIINDLETIKKCNLQNVNGSFVFLHTIGNGEDGNEWQVIGVYKSYNKAYRAKKKYNFDSSIERWRID